MATAAQVRQLFRTHLGREPNQEAIRAFSGFSVDEARSRILRSEEHLRRTTLSAFREFLGRSPESEGVIRDFVNLGDPARIIESVRGSEEARQFTLNQQFPSPTRSPRRRDPFRERLNRELDQARQRERQSAFALIKGTLRRYGLEELSDFAWRQIQQGASPPEVDLRLRETDAFKQRFQAIEQRRRQGLPALSPAEVVEYESNARAMMRAAGLPQGFWDEPEDFTRFLVNDLSLRELQERVQGAQVAKFNSPPEVREELQRMFGVNEGEITAFFLDPDRALPLVQRRLAGAQIGAAARRTGFGELTAEEATGLAQQGIGERGAEEGFANLTRARELFQALPGTQEGDIGRDVQFGAAFGSDVRAQEEVERRRGARLAPFSGGGGFATSREGFGGLGTAD